MSGSGSTNLLSTDPIRIRIHNTGCENWLAVCGQECLIVREDSNPGRHQTNGSSSVDPQTSLSKNVLMQKDTYRLQESFSINYIQYNYMQRTSANILIG